MSLIFLISLTHTIYFSATLSAVRPPRLAAARPQRQPRRRGAPHRSVDIRASRRAATKAGLDAAVGLGLGLQVRGDVSVLWLPMIHIYVINICMHVCVCVLWLVCMCVCLSCLCVFVCVYLCVCVV